jgi:TPR repeat protein
MVACCEYIIAYYYCHEIIPCNEGVSHREEAVAWMTRSANHYYAPAISNLGVYYDIGEGVCKDMKKAAELYQLAAQMNFAPAICNLATCILKGEGTVRDLARAALLFQKSYSHGFIPAATNLGYCYDKGQGVLMNKVEAVRLYRIAAEKGNQSAQFNIGLCYEKGEGVEKDLTQAIHWYEKCAAQGDRHSASKIVMLQNELIAEDCPICLEKANMRGRQILVTPGCCGKLFHEKCFQMLLVRNPSTADVRSHRPQCPCCRELLPTTSIQHISSASHS